MSMRSDAVPHVGAPAISTTRDRNGMILVVGSFEVDPIDRDAFIATRLEQIRISRAEPGCLEYTFAADPLDPRRVVLVERWEDQASLDDHLSGLRARHAEGGASPPAPSAASVVLYDVAAERRMV